jgi:hypothetical protein
MGAPPVNAKGATPGKGKFQTTPQGEGVTSGAVGKGTTGNKGKGKQPDWRAQAEAKKAIHAMWKNFDIRKLPAGPIDTPRWETTFAVQLPDSGTTKATAFVATLAGAYCIKASSPAESFANNFNRWLSAPSPASRVVRAGTQEFADMHAAFLRAAGFAPARGQECGIQRLHRMKMNGHYLVMTLATDASMFGGASPEMGQMLSEPPASTVAATGDAGTWAAATQRAAEICGVALLKGSVEPQVQPLEVQEAARCRLQALGRALFADICLASRDRLMIPLFVSKTTVEAVLRKQAGESGKVYGAGEAVELVDSDSSRAGERYLQALQSFEDVTLLRYLAGHADNTLLQEVGRPERARFAFIDNCVNMISEQAPHPYVCNYLRAVLAEAALPGGPLAGPVGEWEYLRWSLRVACTGYVASDAALREVRLGFLYAVRQFAEGDALAWVRGVLGEQMHVELTMSWRDAKFPTWMAMHRESVPEDKKWMLASYASLLEDLARSVRGVVAPFQQLLATLPPPVETLAHPEPTGVVEADAPYGALPEVWAAMDPQIQLQVLKDIGLSGDVSEVVNTSKPAESI